MLKLLVIGFILTLVVYGALVVRSGGGGFVD